MPQMLPYLLLSIKGLILIDRGTDAPVHRPDFVAVNWVSGSQSHKQVSICQYAVIAKLNGQVQNQS